MKTVLPLIICALTVGCSQRETPEPILGKQLQSLAEAIIAKHAQIGGTGYSGGNTTQDWQINFSSDKEKAQQILKEYSEAAQKHLKGQAGGGLNGYGSSESTFHSIVSLRSEKNGVTTSIHFSLSQHPDNNWTLAQVNHITKH